MLEVDVFLERGAIIASSLAYSAAPAIGFADFHVTATLPVTFLLMRL